jgi:hypothetical protein
VFTCILASSRITRSGSWKTDPSFLRGSVTINVPFMFFKFMLWPLCWGILSIFSWLCFFAFIFIFFLQFMIYIFCVSVGCIVCSIRSLMMMILNSLIYIHLYYMLVFLDKGKTLVPDFAIRPITWLLQESCKRLINVKLTKQFGYYKILVT